MKQSHLIVGGLALAMIASAGLVGAASAHDRGDKSPEDREAIRTALEQRDFESFKALIGEDHPAAERITAENFDNFAERKLNRKDRFKKHRKHHRGFSKENRQALRDAMENRDYTSWQELVGDRKIGTVITAETFDQFVQMHELRKAGEYDKAKAIAQSLGLDQLRKHNKQN